MTMEKRVESNIESKKSDGPELQQQPGIYGAETQLWLCRIGAVVAAATASVVALISRRGGESRIN